MTTNPTARETVTTTTLPNGMKVHTCTATTADGTTTTTTLVEDHNGRVTLTTD